MEVRVTRVKTAVWMGTMAAVVLAAGSMRAQTSKAPVAQAPAVSAAARIDQAIAAMGGETVLRGIKSLTLESIGHGWALEQSERPEGPWLSSYAQRTEVRDYAKSRQWFEAQRRDWNAPRWSALVATVVADGVVGRTNGERWFSGSPLDLTAWNETLALAPERILLTAKAAADLKVLPDETQQRVRQHVLGFSRTGQRIRLYLNAWTHLPTSIEIVQDDRFGIWGDVTERRSFGFWTLEAGGLMYPRQITTEWNNLPFADETVQTLTIDAPVDETKFAIPDAVKTQFAQIATRSFSMTSVVLDPSKAVTLAPGLVQFPSGFNVAVVSQSDGLVILEATTGSAFTQQVIAAAEKQFPGKKVKAVVTTSDAWPHVGGIREYVAKGIPVYALDLNVSILTRILKAPRTFAPDALSKTPKAPVFRSVADRMTLGSGDTRMELIPVRGETGERMMLVWFPGLKLLYSSDLIQRDRTGKSFFMMEMPAEVVDTAAREKLDGIDKVFGMHLPPTEWSEVTGAVRKAKTRAN